MVKKMFCDCQLYAKGDSRKAYACDPKDPEAKLFCRAHLNEAMAFPCPYKPEDILSQDKRLVSIAHQDEHGKRTGFCEDFVPVRKPESQLFQKVEDKTS